MIGVGLQANTIYVLLCYFFLMVCEIYQQIRSKNGFFFSVQGNNSSQQALFYTCQHDYILTNMISTAFRCNNMYSGVRCEHLLLDSHKFSSPEELIGISCGVVLLLGAIFGLAYFCIRKR